MKIKLLGDPHIGRKFIYGVPLARMGERELAVNAQFAAHFADLDCNLHINMGDLFDKSVVSYDLILFAAKVYQAATKKYPLTTFVVLKGNHDLMRDLERKSAFDMFAELVVGYRNIHIISKPTRIGDYGFFAYDALTTAADLMTEEFRDCTAVYGHWDDQGFGSDHNVIPTKIMFALGITTAYTGHVHKPTTFKRDGVDVTLVGSMQPYAFGEQLDDTIYVEHTLESLKVAGDVSQKVVRITLLEGESIDEEIDCLQLVTKRVGDPDQDAPVIEMGDFDMEKLFRQAFAEAKVKTEVMETLLGRYNDQRLKTDN